MTKVYVGNLPYSATGDSLKALFENYGTILTCNVVTDFNTGQSKGFAFVEMESKEDCMRAIQELDNTEFEGRTIKVSIARDRNKDGGGGGGKSRNHSYNNRRW